MARTGVSDPKPLLDLHKRVDERRAPLRALANACGPIDRWQPVEVEESRKVPVKVEPECRWERRLLTQTSEGIIMGFHEDSLMHSDDVEGCVEEHMLLYPHGLQSLHSLQALVPSLLRLEVETALEKLGLIWDRTYGWEMFLVMMVRTQTRSSFPNADLPRHFTDATRAVLVDWLIQVHEMMHFQEETLYLAIHLVNCSLRQIKVVWMARYLLELSLLEGQCVVFLPSQLAGAALCLSRQVLLEPPTPEGEAAWCLASSIHVGSETALLTMMHILANAAAKAHTRETCATFIKFSSPETMHVSRHPGLKNASALLGVRT
ncbi:cyclin N-terminal domain-containing protein 2 isoform X3 [Hippoglossus hippoglossus]|uniref:cyclin N-terminal domain-containing protein 2 isoform X3 n=1 Tax=Hippoglossus hippoglossus TaxID=8267 RepID=UPI00148B8609|nr:cyclin N-terminal domain-containing protein 2 isoform X3 [Hippoglossus hippoglossus]